MPIEKTSYIYEILVRGAPDGVFAGAHQVSVERVVDTDTGDVLSEQVLPARELDPAQVAGVLGAAFGDLAGQLTQARAELAQMKASGAPAPASSQPSAVISDRQFFQGLALRGLCTPQEALEAVRAGVLPRTLRAFVDSIGDADERWAAEMLMAGAKEFRRDHPFVDAVGAWAGLDAAALDHFWAQCLTL